MKTVQERQIFFRMRQQKFTMAQIAAALGVSRSTLQRWLIPGIALPQRPKQRLAQRKLSPTVEEALKACFVAHNTTTLKQAVTWLLDVHGLQAGISTVARVIKNHGITWKKGSKAYSEMNQTRGQDFIRHISDGSGSHVLALDEAAFFWNHSRGYAWSIRGSRAVVVRPGNRGRAHSLLLCISIDGVVKWQLYDGAVNAIRFAEFLAQLPHGSKVILDNAVIHRATNILARQGLATVPEVANLRQIRLAYLPPYAPQLNPVELCFNTIRTQVNRTCPRTRDQLVLSITNAVSTLSQDVCKHTIRKVLPLPII